MLSTQAQTQNGPAAPTADPQPHVTEGDVMKVAQAGQTVELRFCEWGARGMLAVLGITSGADYRPVTVRITNAATEQDALTMLQAAATALATVESTDDDFQRLFGVAA